MEILKNKLIMIQEQSFKYNEKISSTINIINFIRNIIKLQQEPEEVIILIGMDCKNNIIGFTDVSRGTINASQTTGREIFKRAVLMNCNKMIIAHNHPSGDPTPSTADIKMTNEIEKFAKYLDIQLLDHIVIGDNENYSIMINEKV